MTNPNERYRQAKQQGQDGIILIWQEADQHGPRMRFLTDHGLCLVEGARIAASGGILLGAWDTIGFDWLH